jgi:hypothetical protein
MSVMSEYPTQGAASTAVASHEDGGSEPVATVAGTVLSAFFDELEKADGLKDKAAELRKLVLGDNLMAEPAVRAILFPEKP